METPFLSAKGSLLSHVELSREVRMSREQKEESKRGTGLTQQANKRVDAELIDLQTTFLQVQAQLDEYFGAGRVPPGIQESVDLGERNSPSQGSLSGSKRVTELPSPPSSGEILYYRVKSKSAFAR